MDTLLILAGLLQILLGGVWLIARAFSLSLFWGYGCLLPPGWLAFCVRHWRRARACVHLMLLGVATLLVGVVMLANQHPERLQRLLEGRWDDTVQVAGLQLGLRGEVNGQPFIPELAEMVDGVLVFTEGDDLSRRELRIYLPSQPLQEVTLDILPADTSNLPVIEFSWIDPEQPLPEVRRVSHGYTLHLYLKPGRINRMQGELHLMLPPGYATTLSGQVELYTSHLRYLDDQDVDTRFNSRETVEWVILRHFRATAHTQDVRFVQRPMLDMSSASMELALDVMVAGEQQKAILRVQRTVEDGWRVSADRKPLRPVAPRQRAVQEDPLVNTAESVDEPVKPPATAWSPEDRRWSFSLQRLLANPRNYSHLRLRVRT